MSYLYRCKCGKRKSLKRLHTDYIRKPKCPACSKFLTYRDTWQEKKNKDTSNICYCDAYYFPHRKGSNVMCKGYKGEPTQEQINEFHEHLHGQG